MAFHTTLVSGPTVLMEIAGLRVLTDPTFDPPGTYSGSRGQEIRKTRGPAVAPHDVLPVDIALVSHTHHDNLDLAGREILGDIAHVISTPAAAAELGSPVIGLDDFESTSVSTPTGAELVITAVPAQHGPEPECRALGPVAGFVIETPDGPNLYVSGDNSSLEVVDDVARRFGPFGVVVLFLGDAGFKEIAEGECITMDARTAVRAAGLLRAHTVVVAHCDSWGHLRESPAETRKLLEEGLPDDVNVVVMAPGESTEAGP